MKDRIVFDIETKNSFEEVGCYNNLKDLEVSVACFYSYKEDKYFCLEEKELKEFEEYLKKTELLIGFSSKRFDIPVLEKYFNFNLNALPHFDILEEIEKSLGRRVGLGVLAEANIGSGKLSNGAEAINMYKRGEIAALKEYCLQDVKITKEIFELIKKQGYLWVPQKNNPEMIKVVINFQEPENFQYQLI